MPHQFIMDQTLSTTWSVMMSYIFHIILDTHLSFSTFVLYNLWCPITWYGGPPFPYHLPPVIIFHTTLNIPHVMIYVVIQKGQNWVPCTTSSKNNFRDHANCCPRHCHMCVGWAPPIHLSILWPRAMTRCQWYQFLRNIWVLSLVQ